MEREKTPPKMESSSRKALRPRFCGYPWSLYSSPVRAGARGSSPITYLARYIVRSISCWSLRYTLRELNAIVSSYTEIILSKEERRLRMKSVFCFWGELRRMSAKMLDRESTDSGLKSGRVRMRWKKYCATAG